MYNLSYLSRQNLSTVINISDVITIHSIKKLASFKSKAEIHDFWEIVYIKEGKAISISEDKEYILSEGDIHFIKPNAPHQLLGKEDFTAIVITFTCNSKAITLLENKVVNLSARQKEFLSYLI